MLQGAAVPRIAGLGCLILLAAMLAGPAPTATDAPRLVRQLQSQLARSTEIHVEVDGEIHRQLLSSDQAVVAEFPIPGKDPITLDLAAVDPTAAETRFVVVDPSGEHAVDPPAFRSFRGRVLGEPDSEVVLSLFANSLAGFIRTQGNEFTVTPLSFAAGGEVLIRDQAADPDRPDRPFCPAELPQAPAAELFDPPIASGGGPPIGDETLIATVAVDATYEWYEGFPSLEAAQGYILSLMAQVSTIYENEVNVAIEVPYLRVFTVPLDPYVDTTNPSTLLGNLRSEWNANQTGVARSVAHLFSRRPSGGSGVAYVDTLCSNNFSPGNSYDYGVSTLSAQGGSWEKALVAHELGHSFSSVHTHCYSPPIDTCANESGCYQGVVEQSVGTIMSYCDAFTTVFHPRVEDEAIRPAAEQAYPSCVSLSMPLEVPLPPENLAPF